MTKFRNAWVKFFTWVASWFAPPVEPPKPRFDAHAQELIDLAREAKEARWKQIPDPKQTKAITAEEYQQMMREQMEESAPVAPRIYRSASFRFCQDQVSKDYAEQRRAEKQPLKLRVEK